MRTVPNCLLPNGPLGGNMAEGNVQGNQYAGQACLDLFSFICEIYINTETCEEKEEEKIKKKIT